MKKLDRYRLIKEIERYFGTATFSGFPMAVIELSEVPDLQRLSDEELKEYAKRCGLNVEEYEYD